MRPLAARPTPSCICWRWPAGSESSWNSTISIGLGHELPLLVDLMPSGKFLMEDFYYAGGVPAVVRALGDLIHRDALTVNGKTMGENTADAPCWNAEVIHSRENPISEHAGHRGVARQSGARAAR